MSEDKDKGKVPVKKDSGPVRPHKKRKKNSAKLKLIVLLVFLLAAGAAVGIYIYMRTPSDKKVDYRTYFGAEPSEDYGVIFNRALIEGTPVQKEGHWFLPFSVIYYNICDELYYDGFSLLYTDPTQTYSTKPGEASYVDGHGVSYALDYTPCYFGDGGMYIALDYLQLMDYTYYSVDDEARCIRMRNDWSPADTASVTENTQLRSAPGIKNPYIAELAAGDKVTIIESQDKWDTVQIEDGRIGYVKTKLLGSIASETPTVPDGRALPVYVNISMDEMVVMGWHQVFSSSGYDNLADYIKTANGMNVICPTWFTMSDNTGNIQNLGEKKYVDKAHKAGLQVWVMLDNINIDVDELQIMGTTENRNRLVKNVIDAAEALGADGINVDVESINSEVAPSFLQFLREMSAACRNEGLVLSVDNYSPMPHTAFYDRTQQGEIVDYVIVMAYDEHYSGGEEAGTTSSLAFVKQSAERTIQEVPKEKVIVGLPFYSRLWAETPADKAADGAAVIDNSAGVYDSKYKKYTLTSKGLGMEGMDNFVREHDLKLTWLDDIGQYYAEYLDNDVWYRLWIENEKSIDLKMQAACSYDPAGVAFFKIGLEDKETWSTIRKYISR